MKKLTRLQKRDKVLNLGDWGIIPDLYQVCQSLRHSHSGFGDPLEPDRKKELIKYLRVTLKTWEPTLVDSASDFDMAMHDMVTATLTEIGVLK